MDSIDLRDQSHNLEASRGRARMRMIRWGLAIGLLIGMAGLAIGIVLTRDSSRSVQGRLAEAQAALDAGKNELAVDLFGRILEQDQGNTMAIEGLLEVASRRVRAGEYNEAIIAYKVVSRNTPQEVRAWQGLGQAYEAREEWEAAASAYEKWVQLAPDHLEALTALGWAEVNRQHFENAEAYFERAQALEPDQLSILLGLGWAHLAKGEYEHSLEWASRALELASDDDSERDALQLLENLSDADPDSEPLLMLSAWYAERGDRISLNRANQRILKRIAHPMSISLGGQFRFLGYEFTDLPDTQTQMNLYFEVLTNPPPDFRILTHAGAFDIGILPAERQAFGFANLGHAPSPGLVWSEGMIYRDQHTFHLEAGSYAFRIGILDSAKNQRLARQDGGGTFIALGWQLINPKEASVDQLSTYGWKQFDADNLGQAQRAFADALAKNPKHLDALIGINAVLGELRETETLRSWADKTLEEIPIRTDVLLGDVMRFVGYEIQAVGEGSAQIDLYFQVIGTVTEDYKLWLHAWVQERDLSLLPEGRRQLGYLNFDHWPEYPTSAWVKDGVYRDRWTVQLPSADYRFIFGLWLPATETRLPTPDDPQGTIELGWATISEQQGVP